MKLSVAQGHDAAYKRLFSHPEMVTDLLRYWMSEPWARQIRWDTLRKAPSDFVTAALRQRLSDCVWQFWTKSGERLFLLLEFQSSVDRWMALRLLVYVSQLHEQLRIINKNDRLLPGIASVVVYNGRGDWNAPRQFSLLVEGDPESESSVRIGFRYQVVDGKGAQSRDDLVGLLFSLEKAGEEDLPRLIRRLAARLSAPEDVELRRSFEAWVDRVLLPRRLGERSMARIQELEDAMIHLPERITWTEEARLAGLAKGREEGLEEGLKKGREQGREEGLRDGILTFARTLLERRFGKLSRKTAERLRHADLDQLTSWTERALSSPTLRDVFDE